MEFGATLNQRSKLIPYFTVLLAAMLTVSCVESRAQLSGLHITEVMPRNGAALFDEWGETPDWVEITNFSDSPINLRDHGLSNDPDQAFLYRFPHFTLEAGKRVIIFCSGRQSRRVTEIRNLDLVKPVVEGELLHLDAANPESFILHDNGHVQTWLDQSAATHHASQLNPVKAPVFLPIAPDQVPAVFFDGDDDFLELEEIRNARTILWVGSEHPFATDHSRVMFGHTFFIPMIRGANHFLLHPIHSAHLLRFGSLQNGRIIDAAIQPAPVSLSLLRFQTDQPRSINFIGSDRQIPDQNWHGWFSEVLLYDHILTESERQQLEKYLIQRWGLPNRYLHAPFKIPNQAGTLFLSDPAGNRLDVFLITEAPRDVSLARDEISGLFGFSEASSPGIKNRGPFHKGRLDEVEVSIDAGHYPKPITVSLIHSDQRVEIRYTLDGSIPDSNAPIYHAPVTLDETSVLKARAFLEGYLASGTCSHTYLINFKSTIPVISLSGAQDDWYSDERGIYVRGSQGGVNLPHIGANFWREWERSVDVEWIDPEGKRRFVQSVGAKIHGGWSRAAPQKSIALIARSRYGDNRFRGQFFEDRENTEFKQLLLRNTGNDWTSAMLRDVVSQSLMDGLDLNTQAYRPVQVLLNGDYLGLFHLRERANEHFIRDNSGIPSDNIDLVDNTFESLAGDHLNLYFFSRWLLDAETESDGFVEDLEGYIELDNFMDYVISQICLDNQDWPHNNVRLWKERAPEGKWRWLPYDLDATFDPLKVTVSNNTLGRLLGQDTKLTSRVLAAINNNSILKERFIKRFQHHLNTTFTAENILEHLNALADEVRQEMIRQTERWGGIQLGDHVTPVNLDEWASNVDHMRLFAFQRPTYVWQHLAETYALQPPLSLAINLPPEEKGHLLINGFKVNHPVGRRWMAKFFRELDLEITAVAEPGFQFRGWAELNDASESIVVQPSSTRSLTPVFEQIENALPLNLEPFAIASSDYKFDAWPSSMTPGKRPVSMAFLASSSKDPELTIESLSPWGGNYNSLKRSRIMGLGEGGVAFHNTGEPHAGGKGGYAAGAVLALNTQGAQRLFAQWTSGQLTGFDQTYAIRMQYRIGESGSFSSVLNQHGQPLEFVSDSSIVSRALIMGPVELPARLVGQPYIELRWKYYALETGREDGRPALRMDDILISSQPIKSKVVGQTGNVRLSEIMYHPPTQRSNEEFIELANIDDHPIQLAGWRLDRGVQFEFPSHILQPGEYVVISADPDAFLQAYPNASIPLGPWKGKLGNSGELIRLKDVRDNTVDKVQFADEGEWSQRVRGPLVNGYRGWMWSNAHDGGGHSLERIVLGGWSNAGQNWSASDTVLGTAGRQNSVYADSVAPFVFDVMHAPVVPKSTDDVSITARVESMGGEQASVELYFRMDGDLEFSMRPMRDTGEGVFKADISAMPDATVVEFYVQTRTQDGLQRRWPKPTPEGQIANALYQVEDYLRQSKQPVARVITTEAERSQLEAIGRLPWNASSDAQMNATFIIEENGTFDLRYLTGFRIRGTTSRVLNPKNRRVNFTSDNTWRGRASIIFNAVNVPSQVLGSALFRLGGVPAPACRPVVFLENNKNHANAGFPQFGSYAQLEVLDDRFTGRQFDRDSGGNLYRAFGFGSLDYLGPDPLEYQKFGFYTKSTNQEEDDWSDLIRLTRLLNESVDTNYESVVESLVHVESWLRFFAVDTLLANMETSFANGGVGDYAFYIGDKDERATLLPYDLDSILGMSVSGVDTSIHRATANPVPSRFLKSPGFARRYHALLDELASSLFAPEQIETIIGNVLSGWATPEFVDRIQQFSNERRAAVLSQIPRSLTVQVDLPLADPDYLRYYRSDTDSITLHGRADVLQSDKILVQGREAKWSLWDGQWAIEGVKLHAGVNEILIQALDEQGEELEDLRLRVFREGEPEQLYSGALKEDTVWSPELSPIRVSSDLLIPEGVTLTILPGTSVEFMDGAGVTVRGQLRALGTEGQRIYFASQRFVAQRWGGLRFENTMAHNVLNYVTIEWTLVKAGIHLEQSRLDMRGGRWIGAYSSFIVSLYSSLHLNDCIFPDVSNGEPIAGIGIPDGGYWIVENCELGRTTGYADVIDFTGGKRPGPVPQFLNNRFLGGSDDGLDLDGGDGYVEGNTFMNFQKANASTSEAHAIATGLYQGVTSNVTIVRNIFVNNDHDILLKEGAQAHVAHNTFVDSRIGTISLRELERRTQPPGSLFMEGNIFDTENVLHALDSVLKSKPDFSAVIQDSILPEAWAHFGERNHDLDPGFVNKAELDFRLSPRSPVLGLGPVGLDPGAYVLPGLAVQGLPWTTLPDTKVNLHLGGPGVIAYRYRLDDEVWSEAMSITEPLQLKGLSEGLHQLEWLDQNAAGIWRSGETPIQTPAWEVSSSTSPIRISEVYSASIQGEQDESRKWEFIEIVNLGQRVHLLKDYSLTDDLNDPLKYQFARIALAEPGQRVVIGEEGNLSFQGWILPFKLNRQGESVYLFRKVNGQSVLIDQVHFGWQANGWSLGRNESGVWRLGIPTPESVNQMAQLSGFNEVQITEWSPLESASHPKGFIEIANQGSFPVGIGKWTLSTEPAWLARSLTFPDLSFLAPGEFRTIDSGKGTYDIPDELHPEHALWALKNDQGKNVDRIWYANPIAGLSWRRDPNQFDHLLMSPPTPGVGDVVAPDDALIVINEVAADNREQLSPWSTFADWIELWNPNPTSFDLGGLSITDNLDMPLKWVFPDGVVLEPFDYMQIWMDGSRLPDKVNSGFGLKAGGDQVWLFDAAERGGSLLDAVEFGVQIPGHTLGRHPDTFDWVLTDFSPTQVNVPATLGSSDAIRINEWMADPLKGTDWFELFNKSEYPVPLEGLQLSDDPLDLSKHVFPPLSFLGNGLAGYLKLDADGKGNGARNINFKLSASGESILLASPQSEVIDQIDFGLQDEGVSEGRWPDGSDDILPFVFSESPGRMNQLDADFDGLPDLWEVENGFNPSAIGEAFMDSDADGLTNFQEYLAQTHPDDASDVFAIEGVLMAEGNLALIFHAKQGRGYEVQRTHDLQSGPWQTLWKVDTLLKDRELTLDIPFNQDSSPNHYIRLKAIR